MTYLKIVLGAALAVFSLTTTAARPDKILVCHVESETGKVDLLMVPERANHLGNPGHFYEGLTDYLPEEVGASGDGTEDSDGNGIDEGCEPSVTCPCWEESDLLSVTAENFNEFSCSFFADLYPGVAVIANISGSTPGVEGGFGVDTIDRDPAICFTRDFGIGFGVSFDEANACISQIASRCADVGDPIIGGN